MLKNVALGFTRMSDSIIARVDVGMHFAKQCSLDG